MRNRLLNCKFIAIAVLLVLKLNYSQSQGIQYILVDSQSSNIDNYVHLRYFKPISCKIRRKVIETINDTIKYNYYSICEKTTLGIGNYFTDTFTVSKQDYSKLCAIQFLTFADTNSVDTSTWQFEPVILFWDSLSYPIKYCTPLNIEVHSLSYTPLHPNPAREELELPYEPILISDLNGRRMRLNYKNKKLEISEYATGYYFIRTTQGNFKFYKE